MVAHDVDDRLSGKIPLRPFDALTTLMNVARQNHHVRIRSFWRKIPKFQMQIAQNVKAHKIGGITADENPFGFNMEICGDSLIQ